MVDLVFMQRARRIVAALVSAVVLTTSLGVCLLAVGEQGHSMPCCVTDEECSARLAAAPCCPPGSVPTTAAQSPAVAGPSPLQKWAVPVEVAVAQADGPIPSSAAQAFGLDRLKLPHDPPYLRNLSLLI